MNIICCSMFQFIKKCRVIYVAGFSIVMIFSSFNSVVAEENLESITFPVLKECKEKALNYLNEMTEKYEAKVTYKEFDKILRSHTEIIGYISFSLPGFNRKDLEPIINSVIHGCYPTSSYEINRDQKYAFSLLGKSLEENENQGITQNYVVIKKDKIVVSFFKKTPGLEIRKTGSENN